jgi:hypothetical protein
MINLAAGNHVGLVVNTQDPEGRGRVQVLVPHIMPTIYTGWNENLKDISFKTFTTKIFQGDLKEKLLSLLPWAEMASPLWGGGTGAPVSDDTGLPTPSPTEQAVVQKNQTPATPPPSDNRTVDKQDQINNTDGNQDATQQGLNGGNNGCPQYNVTQKGKGNYVSLADAHAINSANVANSGLVNYVPKDGARYGITTGSAEEWTNYFDRQMQTESGTAGDYIRVNESFTESDGTVSAGLFSMSVGEMGLTDSSIHDPCANSAAAISMSANLIKNDGVIAARSSSGGWLGAARYFGPLRRGEVAVNADTPPTLDQKQSQGISVFRTSGAIQNAYGSINGGRSGGPIGVFSPPHVGAKVWVFFKGNDPQKPVCFANVYEPQNVGAVANT